MSQPKRYFLKISQTISGLRCETYEAENGEYVEYADYAALQAENERLNDHLDRIDLAFGKADYEQALDILIEWRKERGEQS